MLEETRCAGWFRYSIAHMIDSKERKCSKWRNAILLNDDLSCRHLYSSVCAHLLIDATNSDDVEKHCVEIVVRSECCDVGNRTLRCSLIGVGGHRKKRSAYMREKSVVETAPR